MHVSGFNETTEHEVADALDQMGDLKGLILDLRQNPGGLLNEGVGVADKFLRKGQLIVSHHGRSSPEKRYTAAHGNGGKEYPLVVLVNRGTASAAEIVAGAIQDHDRGLIVGRNHFRQRSGADRLSALREHWPGADHGEVLHAEHAFDSARLLERFPLRLLLQP